MATLTTMWDCVCSHTYGYHVGPNAPLQLPENRMPEAHRASYGYYVGLCASYGYYVGLCV